MVQYHYWGTVVRCIVGINWLPPGGGREERNY